LIDKIGDFDDAIELIKSELEIKKEEKVELIYYPKKKTLLDYIYDHNVPNNSFERDNRPDDIKLEYIDNLNSSLSLFTYVSKILKPFSDRLQIFSKIFSKKFSFDNVVSLNDFEN
jgi:hypothetical protein